MMGTERVRKLEELLARVQSRAREPRIRGGVASASPLVPVATPAAPVAPTPPPQAADKPVAERPVVLPKKPPIAPIAEPAREISELPSWNGIAAATPIELPIEPPLPPKPPVVAAPNVAAQAADRPTPVPAEEVSAVSRSTPPESGRQPAVRSDFISGDEPRTAKSAVELPAADQTAAGPYGLPKVAPVEAAPAEVIALPPRPEVVRPAVPTGVVASAHGQAPIVRPTSFGDWIDEALSI